MASDHPFWARFGFPPYHFQCRTGLQAVYKSEIENGAVIDNPDMAELQSKFKPLDGFGGVPLHKESWWMMADSMARRAAHYGIFNDIENFARENGLYNFSLNLVKGEDLERLMGTNYAARKAALATPLLKEVQAAKVLEENGYTVYFTPENRKAKNYDAIIDGRLGEFKRAESFGKIIRRLNEADGQRVTNVCLELPVKDHTLDETIKKIRTWFTSGQKPVKYVDTVLLIWEGAVIPIKK
jgi:hypothetical protein